jgi:hypothetical protein
MIEPRRRIGSTDAARLRYIFTAHPHRPSKSQWSLLRHQTAPRNGKGPGDNLSRLVAAILMFRRIFDRQRNIIDFLLLERHVQLAKVQAGLGLQRFLSA